MFKKNPLFWLVKIYVYITRRQYKYYETCKKFIGNMVKNVSRDKSIAQKKMKHAAIKIIICNHLLNFICQDNYHILEMRGII